MILLNINICSFPLRNLTFRTCLCNYGTLYISCRDMKNKYSYLNSKYQTSDTYSVFFKSKLNIRESTEVAIHPGTREPPCPYPGMNLRAEAAPAHLKGWPSSYHPPPRDSCRAYQCSLILLHSSDTPGEPHHPPHLLALEAALEAFTAPLSKSSDIHSSWSFTKK